MIKKNNTIVFVTGQYLPKPGATGLCVHELAKVLATKGYSVKTVCYHDDDYTRYFDDVYKDTVKQPFFMNENRFKNGIKKRFARIVSLCAKGLYIREYPLRSKLLVARYCNKLDEIIKNSDGVVTIIGTYTPIEAVFAVKKIKQKYKGKIKAVYYSTDTLSNECGNEGILSAEYRNKKGECAECDMFKVFDKIFLMECHKYHYEKATYDKYREKIEYVGFPLIIKPELKNRQVKPHKKISCIYAGSLYRVLRNPEFLIKLLSETNDKTNNILASFYGSGDCDDILKKAEIDSDGAIKYFGMRSHEEVITQINEADILLSIGNNDSPMVPSKIYEYMSTGKPIIHTYRSENDSCLQPLRQYGNALLINENMELNINNVIEFISNVHTLEFDEVKLHFRTSMPQYTTDLIEQLNN